MEGPPRLWPDENDNHDNVSILYSSYPIVIILKIMMGNHENTNHNNDNQGDSLHYRVINFTPLHHYNNNFEHILLEYDDDCWGKKREIE